MTGTWCWMVLNPNPTNLTEVQGAHQIGHNSGQSPATLHSHVRHQRIPRNRPPLRVFFVISLFFWCQAGLVVGSLCQDEYNTRKHLKGFKGDRWGRGAKRMPPVGKQKQKSQVIVYMQAMSKNCRRINPIKSHEANQEYTTVVGGLKPSNNMRLI